MLRKLIFRILFLIRIPHLLHYLQRRKKFVPILLFHDVSPEKNKQTGSITPKEFEAIILMLKHKYKIGRLSDIEQTRPESCYITFDDGMKNFQLYAYPILQKHQVPVTLFIPPKSISEGFTWNLKFFDLLKQGMVEKSEPMTPATRPEIGHILNQYKEVVITDSNRLMNWHELKQLDPTIVDIQSHSNSHEFLTALSKEELESDLKASKLEIMRHLDRPVESIAYPMGDHNNGVLHTAGQHFKYGFITSNKCLNSNEMNHIRMQIPRFHVDNPDKYELYARLNGVHEKVLTVKERLPIEKNEA